MRVPDDIDKHFVINVELMTFNISSCQNDILTWATTTWLIDLSNKIRNPRVIMWTSICGSSYLNTFLLHNRTSIRNYEISKIR